MMTRDEIRELAAFQADETKGACALSFYFQPDPPQDRSHRREADRRQDIVKQALKSAAASAKNGALHADLDRVLDLATNLRGNARGKAVFALLRAEFLEGVRTASAAGRHAHLSSAAFSVETAGRLAGSAARALRRRGRPPACPYLRPAARRPARTRSHCPHALAQRIELRLQRLRSRTCRATRVRGSAAAFQGSCQNGCAPTSRKASGSGSLSDARMPTGPSSNRTFILTSNSA